MGKELQEVVIVSAARTPVGSFRGCLASVKATELGSIAIRAAVDKAGIKPEDVQEVYMGMICQAGAKQAPAKQTTLNAGIPASVPCTTVNKMCASGLKAAMMAAQSIMCGHQQLMVAGGMESMSNVPFYMARGDTPYGGITLHDGILMDALLDAYDEGHMGMAAEKCAVDYGFSKQDQDTYAVESYKRAAEAWKNDIFKDEVVPVTVKGRKGDTIVNEDEEYKKVIFDKIPTLKPAFKKDGGTVTAANASSLNDGAAALVLASADKAAEMGLTPVARVLGFADASQKPVDFTTAPALAMPKALAQAGLRTSDVDLWEINEAFSVVALANMKLMGIDHSAVNVHGGGVSIGHPVGMSGARILGHLVHVLKPGQKGMAGICNGGGGAAAMVIEKL